MAPAFVGVNICGSYTECFFLSFRLRGLKPVVSWVRASNGCPFETGKKSLEADGYSSYTYFLFFCNILDNSLFFFLYLSFVEVCWAGIDYSVFADRTVIIHELSTINPFVLFCFF